MNPLDQPVWRNWGSSYDENSVLVLKCGGWEKDFDYEENIFWAIAQIEGERWLCEENIDPHQEVEKVSISQRDLSCSITLLLYYNIFSLFFQPKKTPKGTSF